MKDTIRVLLDEYVRKTLVPFTESDVSKYLLKKKHPCTVEKIREYLQNSSNVFVDMYGKFFSRAGIFSSRYFSFVPTKTEVENGYLIIGHRMMPFVDPEILPSDLHFFFCGDMISKKRVVVNSHDIYPLYQFFGEEYVPQIIAQDTANLLLDLSETDFELPSEINLTVLNLEEFYRRMDFKVGDRIVALVSDWDKGFINIAPFRKRNSNPFEQTAVDKKREKWEESFEKSLCTSLDTFGPCASIEEQLAFAYLNNLDKFCVTHCSSVQEVLSKSKKFEFTLYGVETRLWFKDKQIPAMNPKMMMNPPEELLEQLPKKETKIENLLNRLGLLVPEWVFDAFVLDALFNKSDELDKIVEKIVPDLIVLEESDYKAILLHLEKKYDILRKGYNWFADYQIAKYRHEILELYSKIVTVFYEIEYQKVNLQELDQQHLVILTQLSGHVSSLIYSFTQQDAFNERDLPTLEASLEGMNFNFEESAKIIKDNLFELQKRKFGIVRNSEEKNG